MLKHIPDNAIDLLVTDPPYPTTSRGCAGNSGGMLQKKINKQGKVFQYNNINCSEYAPEFFRILKEGSHCYIMCNHTNLINMLNSFTSVGFHFIKSLIWNKCNKIMGTFYMSQFEYILFFRKGKGKKINHCGTSDILTFPNKKDKDSQGNNWHDTQKPVDLMKVLIDNSSIQNEIILDPFMGIGSTGIAALQLDRKFMGIEIDPTYYQISQQRIKSTINQIGEEITNGQSIIQQ